MIRKFDRFQEMISNQKKLFTPLLPIFDCFFCNNIIKISIIFMEVKMKKLIIPLVVILIFMANIALAETAEEWIFKGDEALIDGKGDEAIKCYKKAISINPDDAMAHYKLGVVYHKKGMIDEAIVEFKKAISINPDNADAHLNLGLAYDGKGMTDEAIAEFKKAIKKFTSDYPKKGKINEITYKFNYAMAHNNLGVLYSKKGMIDEAISTYKKVIEINPDNAMAHYRLGAAYCVKKKVSLGGDYFYRAGLIFLKKGKKKWALKAYEALKLTKSEELQKKLFKKLYPDIK
jgi:tetratricopeptide (TPR) repeat protein